MSIIVHTTKLKAPRICVYGKQGIGKSSFGASMPSPVFIDIEGGLEALGVQATEQCRYFQDVLDFIGYLTGETHPFKTVVIDTLDWLEKLIYADVCAEAGVSDIGAIGWGKGYIAAEVRWQKLFKALSGLRESKGMYTVLNCHQRIVEFKDPERENYDVYTLDLYQGKNVDTVNMVCEWCDMVIFMKDRVVTQKGEADPKAKAKGTGQRQLCLQPKPTYLAKCRYSGFPDVLEYKEHEGWQAIAGELKKFKAAQKPVANKPLPALTKEAIAEADAATEAEYRDDAAARAARPIGNLVEAKELRESNKEKETN